MCGTENTENSNRKQYVSMAENIGILYEDSQILVCHKPAGLPVQSANARVKDMVSILKLYLQQESGQDGEPYLGIVHRLDQPVQGVILFAKTKQAAANLSEQVAERRSSGEVIKRYCAVVHANPDRRREENLTAEYQELIDYLQRDRRTNTSYIVPKGTKGAKECRLRYAILMETEGLSLVDIELLTGRHHQIRVQLAGAGMPIVGDKKYASSGADGERKGREMPALCAYSLRFRHPKTGEVMEFAVKPEGGIFEKFRAVEEETA